MYYDVNSIKAMHVSGNCNVMESVAHKLLQFPPSSTRSDDRVTGLSGNATTVVTVASHHDVSFHSPARTPAEEEEA